jgi:phosphatidylglycerophosphate synthase
MITQAQCGTGSAGQEQAAGVGAQLILLTLLWAGVGLSPAGWLAGAAYAVAIWAILSAALRRSGTRSLGPADLVTLARAVLVGGVTALVTDGAAAGTRVLVLVALASVALVLDAVDGHVARRTGTSSPLGARFDMEVDAFLILVLSVYVAMTLGAWVLAIGVMRYAFVAAARVLPWLSSPLPPSFARKTVAALQGVVLVVTGARIIPDPVAAAAVGLALASLVWSFGRDIVWLWQNSALEYGAVEYSAVEYSAVEPHGAVPPMTQYLMGSQQENVFRRG